MWVGVKCQPNTEIAGSPRNVLRYSHAAAVVEVERWMGTGPSAGYQLQPNCECHYRARVSETAGAKLRRREGNNPDPQLRSLMIAQCQRGSVRPNSQDVGLEAAIIERVRNSSLVECTGTENVARLKRSTEARDSSLAREDYGRGAFLGPRSLIVRTGGAPGSANAGMSSVIYVRTIDTESLRVPGHRQSSQGQSGPKPRTL